MRLGIRIKRKKSKVKDYAYITARVRAKKRKLLKREDYQKLLKMGPSEILRFLGESEYREEIDELSEKYSGVELIERALKLNLARTYRGLIEISSGEVREMIAGYLRRWDIWNIKCILRGKRVGADPEEIKSLLIPCGDLSEEFLNALVELQSVEDVIEALSNTRYYRVLRRHEELHWRELEDELEKMYYEDLLNLLEGDVSEDKRLLLRIIKMEIDVKNLRTLLRLKRDGVDPRDIEHHLIRGGEEIDERELRRLLTLSYEDLARALGEYSYGKIIENALERGSLISAETALEKYRAEYAHKLSYYYPLSILPVIGYIVSKEHESHNLHLIARAKELGIAMERIEEQLVI